MERNEKQKNDVNLDNIKLNVNAAEYKPKKKKVENNIDNIKLNPQASEYHRKIKEFESPEFDVDAEKEEKMMADLIENLAIEQMDDDEDKYLEKYKNCTCCKGFVNKCKGEVCRDLGQCYCIMYDECTEEKGE